MIQEGFEGRKGSGGVWGRGVRYLRGGRRKGREGVDELGQRFGRPSSAVPHARSAQLAGFVGVEDDDGDDDDDAHIYSQPSTVGRSRLLSKNGQEEVTGRQERGGKIALPGTSSCKLVDRMASILEWERWLVGMWLLVDVGCSLHGPSFLTLCKALLVLQAAGRPSHSSPTTPTS